MDLCHIHLQPEFEYYLGRSNEPPELHPKLKIAIATYAKNRGFSFDIQDASESSLPTFIEQRNSTRQGPEKPDASLELVFVPMRPRQVRLNLTRDSFSALIELIGLDPALVAFLFSSGSCFHYIIGDNGCHSFLYKDYPYALAWTFDARTLLTKALLTERDEYKKSTTSFYRDSAFDIPGLPKHHLFHPLSLALLVLIDINHRCNHMILDESWSV